MKALYKENNINPFDVPEEINSTITYHAPGLTATEINIFVKSTVSSTGEYSILLAQQINQPKITEPSGSKQEAKFLAYQDKYGRMDKKAAQSLTKKERDEWQRLTEELWGWSHGSKFLKHTDRRKYFRSFAQRVLPMHRF